MSTVNVCTDYASGLESTISRLSSITDSGATLASYSYLGRGTVVIAAHPQTGVDLSYVKLSGESVGDAGDQYTGLDRFGRIVDERWRNGSTDADRFTYTYDRDGNRLTKTNVLNSALNEVYTYDGLNQVASFDRGSGTRTQSFDYDALGNRDGVTTNGSTQTYTANKQNEITSISGATTPTYDANGNMTTDETGKQYVYDAWNRLVAVKNSSGTTLKTYGYDGLNQRVSETASGTTTDLYYSAGWQVLEERVAGATTASNVWSPTYVDAMIARDRDTDGNGSLDERLYVTHDANFNVTALVNTSGSVVERYVYDTYGAATVMNASWSTLGGSAYAWQYLFQGGRLDSTSGLEYFRNRDYSLTLGRWTTMDPIGYLAGDANLFRAIGNHPNAHSDPYGLDENPQLPIDQLVYAQTIGIIKERYRPGGLTDHQLSIMWQNTVAITEMANSALSPLLHGLSEYIYTTDAVYFSLSWNPIQGLGPAWQLTATLDVYGNVYGSLSMGYEYGHYGPGVGGGIIHYQENAIKDSPSSISAISGNSTYVGVGGGSVYLPYVQTGLSGTVPLPGRPDTIPFHSIGYSSSPSYGSGATITTTPLVQLWSKPWYDSPPVGGQAKPPRPFLPPKDEMIIDP